MSSKAGGGGGGSTKLDRKTSQQTVTNPTYKEEIEKDWRLILHDDTVHTIQQVCDIVSLCCPLCTGNFLLIILNLNFSLRIHEILL